jgi:hypothetical protein
MERHSQNPSRNSTQSSATASSVIQPAHIREVAVIWLGLMGSGIAELLARSGRRVVAIEINQTFLYQGRPAARLAGQGSQPRQAHRYRTT